MLTKLFFPTSFVRKNLLLKYLNNKFFSIYNYLFRFFCLFGFQWTVLRTMFAGRPKWTRTTFKTYLSLCSRKAAYAFKGFVVYLVLLVGPSGLEPPTSCLSGTRSNLLSYEPMWLVWILFTLRFCSLCLEASLLTFLLEESKWWRWWDSNPWPPACRAGALPAELHPHFNGW